MTYRVQVVPKKKRRMIRVGKTRKIAYGLQAIASRLTCPPMKERIFCDLPKSVLAELDEISSPATFCRDAILFVEGQEPCGIFIVCTGRVKLSTSSPDGKSIIVRVAEPGELVGLPGTISGELYELTAEALEPVQANFIPREAFLQFLRQRGETAVRIAQILSQVYRATLSEVRYLALSASTTEKLARFLLGLSASPVQSNGHIRATFGLTHREVAERIGASRETVTRLFASFKRDRLVEFRGSALIIVNKEGLEKLLDA